MALNPESIENKTGIRFDGRVANCDGRRRWVGPGVSLELAKRGAKGGSQRSRGARDGSENLQRRADKVYK